jgi:hypothetical protein
MARPRRAATARDRCIPLEDTSSPEPFATAGVHRKVRVARALLLLALPALAGCSDTERATPPRGEFVVDVAGERFVLALTEAETIRLARESLAGRRALFPIGPLREGDGGFNQPWSWHLDPAETRMTEAALEVCDGRPSYVEAHRQDFPTYCPWGARLVAERP